MPDNSFGTNLASLNVKGKITGDGSGLTGVTSTPAADISDVGGVVSIINGATFRADGGAIVTDGAGKISAAKFAGDGSLLTNVPTGGGGSFPDITDADFVISFFSGAVQINADGSASFCNGEVVFFDYYGGVGSILPSGGSPVMNIYPDSSVALFSSGGDTALYINGSGNIDMDIPDYANLTMNGYEGITGTVSPVNTITLLNGIVTGIT